MDLCKTESAFWPRSIWPDYCYISLCIHVITPLCGNSPDHYRRWAWEHSLKQYPNNFHCLQFTGISLKLSVKNFQMGLSGAEEILTGKSKSWHITTSCYAAWFINIIENLSCFAAFSSQSSSLSFFILLPWR